jgi:hypothetical protein
MSFFGDYKTKQHLISDGSIGNTRETDNSGGIGFDSGGDVSFGLGNGMSIDSSGDIGFNVGGIRIDSGGDIGFNFGS